MLWCRRLVLLVYVVGKQGGAMPCPALYRANNYDASEHHVSSQAAIGYFFFFALSLCTPGSCLVMAETSKQRLMDPSFSPSTNRSHLAQVH
jgi:sulfite exporter TauE/SafE